MDLYWRLQEIGKLVNLDDVLGDYRLSPTSISNSSIINGRIQSLSSQLAAISAMRRRSNLPDIVFPRSAIRDYQGAVTLREMTQVAAAQLPADEAAPLCAIAASEKLRQLATYRSYELELSDCHFISASYERGHRALSLQNQRDIAAAAISGAAARLLLRGQFGIRITLSVHAPLYPSMILRAFWAICCCRLSMWQLLRRIVWQVGILDSLDLIDESWRVPAMTS